jgi:hypothetical protein
MTKSAGGFIHDNARTIPSHLKALGGNQIS